MVYSVDLSGGTLWRFNKNPANPQPAAVISLAQGFDIESDATHLYWTEPASGSVQRINKDPFGCLPSAVCAPEAFATTAARPWALVADNTHVYWIALSDNAIAARLERRPKMGGAEETLVDPLGMVPRSIAEAGDFVFWVQGDVGQPGQLWKLRKPQP